MRKLKQVRPLRLREYEAAITALKAQHCQSASNSFQVSASKFFQLLRLI